MNSRDEAAGTSAEEAGYALGLEVHTESPEYFSQDSLRLSGRGTLPEK
jgi:hypothetical protein